MTTRTTSRRPEAHAATIAAVAFLAAIVLVGPATPTARAGVSAIAGPTLTVARGTTSAQTSGWRFSEVRADEFPVLGFSIVIEIRPYQGAPDGISFDQSSAPRFNGPGSLDGTAYFAGSRTLRIDIGSSAFGQLESFEVVDLRLKASETCGLGPVVVSYTNPGFSGNFGFLPSLATTGGGTASPSPSPSPSPTATTSPSPSPTTLPIAVTTSWARVALGRPGAYTTAFRANVTAAQGARVTVRATVRPVDAGRAVALYRRIGSSGSWRFVANLTADATGTALAVTRATLPAGWSGSRQVQFRWYVPAAPGRTAAWSDVARVIVK
jgi:hypothetical protein